MGSAPVESPGTDKTASCQGTMALAYVVSHLARIGMRRCGREAEGDGLLNRYRGNPIVGSNPTVSAIYSIITID
jgi:hypothetical protein